MAAVGREDSQFFLANDNEAVAEHQRMGFFLEIVALRAGLGCVVGLCVQ